MNPKRMNTIPYGMFIVILIAICFGLTFLLGLFFLPNAESIGFFMFSLIFFIAFVDYISKKHWNIVTVSTDRISHGKFDYCWDEVFITLKQAKPTFARNSLDLYVFFDDHYLSPEETESKAIKRKGFYLVLTYERAKFLLPFYQKRIRVLNQSVYQRNEKIMALIESHNSKHPITS